MLHQPLAPQITLAGTLGTVALFVVALAILTYLAYQWGRRS